MEDFKPFIIIDLDEYKQEHEELTERYLQLKRNIQSLIESDDDEELANTAGELKKTYCEMQAMFWKIKEEEVQMEINQLKQDNPDDYESVKYYELLIEKFQHYDNYAKYHYMAKNQDYTYTRSIRPVVDHKIIGFHNCIDSVKRRIRVFGK